jgi:hypothetical protein
MSLGSHENSWDQESDFNDGFPNENYRANISDVVTADANMGFFSLLPQDCLDNLLLFLSLHNCLDLSCTSLMFLEELNRELKKRRRRMKHSFAYSCLSTNGQYKLLAVSGGLKETSENVFLLPTVSDRINSLYHALPASYSARPTALELRIEIERGDEEIENAPLEATGNEAHNIRDRFRAVFQVQQNLVRAHRFHARLLSQAIKSNPGSWDGLEQEGGRILSVHLQQYIGDVLCAYYLMGHSVSGIVEGGPSEDAWMDSVLSEARSTRQNAARSYRAWIYLHSTLLRMAPFAWSQQALLGIASPASAYTSSLDVARGSLLRPHLPFACGLKNHDKRAQVWDALRTCAPLRMTLNDFGRLGPTFRGRDLIQSQTVFPSSCIGVTREFCSMTTNDYANVNALSPFLTSWCSGEESVITWLLFLHREAGKTRPMTVAPPLVTIKCSNNQEGVARSVEHTATVIVPN